jgi:DNA-binding MarR family transcriptional regulator
MKADSLPLSEYQAVASLRATLRTFLRVSEHAARRHGLTQQRYVLLLMIKGAPVGSQQSTVTELSDRLQLAPSTVTELVARAEQVGLVTRAPSPDDGRVVHFSLTGMGEQRLEAVLMELQAERERLARMIAAYAEAEHIGEATPDTG